MSNKYIMPHKELRKKDNSNFPKINSSYSIKNNPFYIFRKLIQFIHSDDEYELD